MLPLNDSEIVPRLAAGLASLAEPPDASRSGLPAIAAPGALVPSAPAPPAPAPPAAPPPVDSNGLPSGWPENIPYPPLAAESSAAALPTASPAAPSAEPLPGPGPAAGPAPSLPGMPAINGNVYMFGNEINAKDSDEPAEASTALTKADRNVAEIEPEAEPEKPNFTRPNGGFPLSGGGTMNVGTMVVVNQPSGTVNINASSPTAATFESRLRQKGPAPLSNIAEPAGLQMPVPLSPKEMPLRMNFQGRLDSAVPVKWPELFPAPMRKKMFLGSPAKARKPEPAETYAMRPIHQPPPAPRPGAAPVPEAAPDDKSGAMGWIKSFSNRFGKK